MLRQKMKPIVFLAWIFLLSCTDSSTGPVGPTVESRDGKFFIVDRTGKSWDVTHAKEKYNMDPFAFQFGLGPFAITPLLNPEMLAPGDPGYPEVPSPFMVLGVSLANDPRAYPIRVLSWYEIADEVFGETHVAVAY